MVEQRFCKPTVAGSTPAFGSNLMIRVWTVMKVINRKKAATICLVLGTFFNPLGYDVLLKWTMNMTGGYWNGIFIFYLVSASLFTAYFLLSRNK